MSFRSLLEALVAPFELIRVENGQMENGAIAIVDYKGVLRTLRLAGYTARRP